MFRKKRHEARKSITQNECKEIMKGAKRGVLAVAGDDDYPFIMTSLRIKSIFIQLKQDIKLIQLRRILRYALQSSATLKLKILIGPHISAAL